MKKPFTWFDWGVLGFICAAAILGALHIAVGLPVVLPKLLSQEVAAWVQAFGSLAAIWGAVWIGQSAERSARAHALHIAKRFADAAAAAVGGATVCFGGTYEVLYVERFLAELAEVQLMGRDVEISRLPDAVGTDVIQLRRNVARSLLLATRLMNRTVGNEFQAVGELNTALQMLRQTWEETKSISEAMSGI